MNDTTVNPHQVISDAIKGTETFDPLIGTAKIYFDQGNDRYSVDSCGPRYLIIIKMRPGKIGSLIIPDTYRPQETVGWVVALGDGIYNPRTGETTPPPRKIGDMVIFGAHAGSEVQLGDKQFRLMQYDSVMGVLSPEGKVPLEVVDDEDEG